MLISKKVTLTHFIFAERMDKAPETKKPRLADETNGYPIQLYHSDPRNEYSYQESLKNPESFWDDLAKNRIRWMKDYDQVMEVDMNTGSIKWFLGGVLNVSGKIYNTYYNIRYNIYNYIYIYIYIIYIYILYIYIYISLYLYIFLIPSC